MRLATVQKKPSIYLLMGLLSCTLIWSESNVNVTLKFDWKVLEDFIILINLGLHLIMHPHSGRLSKVPRTLYLFILYFYGFSLFDPNRIRKWCKCYFKVSFSHSDQTGVALALASTSWNVVYSALKFLFCLNNTVSCGRRYMKLLGVVYL